ncbi:hypothetical protein HNY73_016500 [Argiope bruennichi]|uniref:Uncharacterized protein n=1 Tax=Argiope bruennichi TaxID=94029 RepID=A0A8T0ENX7_ARGBR|nr:hypothetical protein HNY73_016500 [Argiope bruennichi]
MQVPYAVPCAGRLAALEPTAVPTPAYNRKLRTIVTTIPTLNPLTPNFVSEKPTSTGLPPYIRSAGDVFSWPTFFCIL